VPGFPGGLSAFDDRVVPWVTFTEPEVGRVGMTEGQAFAVYGRRARVAVVNLKELDRARTASRADGYIKLIAGPRRFAAQGALAMRTHMLAARLAQTIAPYPTYALGLRLAAAGLFGEFGGSGWRPAGPGR